MLSLDRLSGFSLAKILVAQLDLAVNNASYCQQKQYTEKRPSSYTTLKKMGQCSSNASANGDDLPLFTWPEIKKHAKSDDCYVVLNNIVYDLTEFSKIHPGGARMITGVAGTAGDVTFTSMHDESYLRHLKRYAVGIVEKERAVLTVTPSPTESDNRQ